MHWSHGPAKLLRRQPLEYRYGCLEPGQLLSRQPARMPNDDNPLLIYNYGLLPTKLFQG